MNEYFSDKNTTIYWGFGTITTWMPIIYYKKKNNNITLFFADSMNKFWNIWTPLYFLKGVLCIILGVFVLPQITDLIETGSGSESIPTDLSFFILVNKSLKILFKNGPYISLRRIARAGFLIQFGVIKRGPWFRIVC